MPDLYLQALMRGEISTKPKIKDRYELAMEKYLDEYVSFIPLDDEVLKNSLMTPFMKRARLKEQAREELDMSWLSPHIEFAFKILNNPINLKLDAEKHQSFIEEFLNVTSKLDSLSLDDSSDNNFQNMLSISDNSMLVLWNTALNKYSEEDYKSSLAIYALLSVLESDNQEYWLRVGIVAQKCEDYQTALKGYSNALSLNPNNLEARLLRADCYLKSNQRLAAENELQYAKKHYR